MNKSYVKIYRGFRRRKKTCEQAPENTEPLPLPLQGLPELVKTLSSVGHYPSIIQAYKKSGKLCRLGYCVVTDHRERRRAVRCREVRTFCLISTRTLSSTRSAKEAWIGSYSGSHISPQDNKWMLHLTFRNQVTPCVAPDQYLHQELFSAPSGNTA